MSEQKRQSSQRTKSRKQSQQKAAVDKQKPRYSVNAMDDEDIAPYYERVLGGMMLAGALLIGYGLLTVIGRLRTEPFILPDSLTNIPLEAALIFAGILVIMYQEPASTIVAGAALIWTLVPRWLFGVETTFPLQNTILFLAVVYFGAQFINFRRARERYQNLPEKHRNPDIEVQEIRSDAVYPGLGLGISVVGVVLGVAFSSTILDIEAYVNLGAILSVLGFALGLAAVVAYEKQRLASAGAVVLSALGLAFWVGAQLIALTGFF